MTAHSAKQQAHKQWNQSSIPCHRGESGWGGKVKAGGSPALVSSSPRPASSCRWPRDSAVIFRSRRKQRQEEPEMCVVGGMSGVGQTGGRTMVLVRSGSEAVLDEVEDQVTGDLARIRQSHPCGGIDCTG